MPIGFATENHETLLDVHHIIHALEKQYSGTDYVQMACVNDHPQFLAMVAEWADAHIAELLSEQAMAVNPQFARSPSSPPSSLSFEFIRVGQALPTLQLIHARSLRVLSTKL